MEGSAVPPDRRKEGAEVSERLTCKERASRKEKSVRESSGR